VKKKEIERIGIRDENQCAHLVDPLVVSPACAPTRLRYHALGIASNLRACHVERSKLARVVAPARQIATHVLYRVLHDEAWASPTLDAELQRGAFSRADAALATQIVYGTLRVVPELEAAMRRHARRPIKVDDWVRAVLLGGAFQLLHLQRVPPHAIVHDAVQLATDKRGKRVAGFVNAILRKMALERPADAEPPDAVSVSPWLRDALVDSIGAEHANGLLRVDLESPSIDLRVRADADREALGHAILEAQPHASVTPTRLSPFGLRVSGAGDPRELPGYAQGVFAVQEEGAQLIGLLLDAQPGERVLDVCAGRGGKTAQLAEAVGEGGRVVATDLHEHRLEQIAGELARLRMKPESLETACVDWTLGPGGLEAGFDRVLVDAPCTGLGTLRRRPEILLRASPGDAAQMGETQLRILHNAAPMVRRGGSLLYAVCSPLSEEGNEVARQAQLPGFERVEEPCSALKSLCFGSSGELSLGPWVPGAGPWADAYQVYMWVNVG
jgi:16S rRNA (cytosine967-C5)-methyltransferase